MYICTYGKTGPVLYFFTKQRYIQTSDYLQNKNTIVKTTSHNSWPLWTEVGVDTLERAGQSVPTLSSSLWSSPEQIGVLHWLEQCP